MKIFLSWLIANFETIAFVMLGTVFGILFLSMGAEVIDPAETFGVVLMIFLIMGLPTVFTTRDFMSSLMLFALFVAGYVYLIAHYSGLSSIPELKYGLVRLFICGAVSLVLSIAAGIFTAANMDDVVSRRMLYVNSNVQLFEKTLSYSLNRFMVTFSYLSWAGLWTVWYMMIKMQII